MEKIEYFPRKKLFEDVQELVASFYSTGDYFTNQSSLYSSILSEEGIKDEFFFPLLTLSMLSGINNIIKLSDSIIRNMNNMRVRRKNTSVEDFKGEIDIEEYVKRNHVERVTPKEYPSIISISTFQIPEYQLTLWILKHCESIYKCIFMNLGPGNGISAFEKSHINCEKLHSYSTIMQKKYGVAYGCRETYYSLKKKVIYRYRNRKLLSRSFIDLMNYYERILKLKGINMDSPDALEIIDHSENFDDRLFEIWLIKQSVQIISKNKAIHPCNITYLPLYRARKKNTYSASISFADYRIEILFQNRKGFMPKEKLKWYYCEDGKIEEIGAIPDLVFLKYDSQDCLTKIVLVDAKNRTWTFANDMQKIKSEIVQQIYIQDNFEDIFGEEYHSMLVAHNIEEYQSRKYNHKDHPKYEIDVISLDFSEHNLIPSLEYYGNDLCAYLGV